MSIRRNEGHLFVTFISSLILFARAERRQFYVHFFSLEAEKVQPHNESNRNDTSKESKERLS